MSDWRPLRRAVQVLSLAAFLALLVTATYPRQKVVPVDLFLKLSPLIGWLSALCAWGFYPLFALCLIVPALTVLIGRFFCGWVCPLGTTIDGSDWLLRRLRREPRPPGRRIHHVKYAILIVLLVFALSGINLVGWFDPIALSTRFYGLAVHPYAYLLVDHSLGAWRDAAGENAIGTVLGAVMRYLFHPLVPDGQFTQPYFYWHAVTALLVVGILLLGLLRRRYYCRVLCPLGALLGIIGRFSVVRRFVSDACTECLECVRNCKMAAIGGEGKGNIRGECIECLECVAVCPVGAITFGPRKVRREKLRIESHVLPVDYSRRELLFALGGSLLAMPIFRLNLVRERHRIREGLALGSPLALTIRPPCPTDEKEFLSRCVRCGECMKICPTNGIQPLLFQEGLEGLWTPTMVMRLGYCEFTCTACMEVCPTGALTRLPLEEKKRFVIGKAVIDKSKCIPWRSFHEWREGQPWSDALNCKVCEEHCPARDEVDHGKAIRIERSPVQTAEGPRSIDKIYVVDRICIGCGICEKVCPVEGDAAIRVYRTDERGPVRPGGMRRRRRRRRGWFWSL